MTEKALFPSLAPLALLLQSSLQLFPPPRERQARKKLKRERKQRLLPLPHLPHLPLPKPRPQRLWPKRKGTREAFLVLLDLGECKMLASTRATDSRSMCH